MMGIDAIMTTSKTFDSRKNFDFHKHDLISLD